MMRHLWKPISQLTDIYQQPIMIASLQLIDGDRNPLGISEAYWQDTTGPEEGEWRCVDFDMCNDEYQTMVLSKEAVTHFLIPEGPFSTDIGGQREGVGEPIVASLIRDAIESGTDEAADYAAERITAYLSERLAHDALEALAEVFADQGKVNSLAWTNKAAAAISEKVATVEGQEGVGEAPIDAEAEDTAELLEAFRQLRIETDTPNLPRGASDELVERLRQLMTGAWSYDKYRGAIADAYAALSTPEATVGLEAAWRDGWAECKNRLTEDEAFCLTVDVEDDAWLDSKTQLSTPEASEETCPICEGREMGPGEGCLAGCREGKVLWTSANVLRNVKFWMDADRREIDRLRADTRGLVDALEKADTQVSHGLMGDWSIALREIRKTIREALAQHRGSTR